MIALHVILTINITTVKLITRGGGRGLKLVKIDYILLCERSQNNILYYFNLFYNSFIVFQHIFNKKWNNATYQSILFFNILIYF